MKASVTISNEIVMEAFLKVNHVSVFRSLNVQRRPSFYQSLEPMLNMWQNL